jgi:hypothetical protein
VRPHLTIVDYATAEPFIRAHEQLWGILTNTVENHAATWIGVRDREDIIGVLGIRATSEKRFFINGFYCETDWNGKPTFAGKRAIYAMQQIINKMPEQICGRIVLWNYRMLKWAERNGFELYSAGDNSMYAYRPARELACH